MWTHHAHSLPTSPALVLDGVSEAGERTPSLTPGWQRGRSPRACVHGAPWSLGQDCRPVPRAMTALSGVTLHAWLEASSRKDDPLGGPPNGPEQEPLGGNSRQQGRLWVTGSSETPLSWGCRSLYYPPRGKPRCLHQIFKEMECAGDREGGQARGLHTDTSKS